MRDEILRAAEARIRRDGFHGFSFRDLAADVGIRSASVHYHFPTKADLGVNLMKNCQEQMFAAFGDADDDRTLAMGDPTLFNRVTKEATGAQEQTGVRKGSTKGRRG